MTNEELEVAIGEVLELDGRRTQGEWEYVRESINPEGFYKAVFNNHNEEICEVAERDDGYLIALAPKMIKIIRQLWEERKSGMDERNPRNDGK